MNLPVAVVLPGGLYFANTVYYMDRETKGAGTVQGEVNLPAFIWSTPFDFLGGHVEAIAAVPELISVITRPVSAGPPSTIRRL